MAKIKAVTHSGSFHADDVFALATLLLALGEGIELTRTRDPEIIAAADIVFDVGRQFDPAKKHFDHHQEGGAGKRKNGIPYASFGLIWREYGNKICSEEEMEKIDQMLVQVVDAEDSAVELYKINYPDVKLFTIGAVIGCLNPTSLEEGTEDQGFMKAVGVAKLILNGEIANAREYFRAKEILKKTSEEAEDKRLVILDQGLSRETIDDILGNYPEVLYFVKPYHGMWSVTAVSKDKNSFETRKPLPEKWAGKADRELQEITGVKDAHFCHNGRFIATTESKEGAIALAKLAIEA